MNNKNIAYLAPEIPALSATFVYQEILELEKLDLEIFPVSIHRPINKAEGEQLSRLEGITFYLYEQKLFKTLRLNLKLILLSPIKYLLVFRRAIKDSLKVGMFSHVGRGLIYRFFIAAGFVDFLKKNNIEHVHANFSHIPTDIAMYASELYGIRFSFISHANDLFERGWLLKEKIDRSKFSVTISDFNKKFLINKGADANKINVIHCGVDTSQFKVDSNKKVNNTPLLGSLGRMVEKKGFDDLIKACHILKKEGLDFKLQLAGGGPLKNELEELVKSFGLNNTIDFIDYISHEKVPEWIKSLDIFVLPCKKDQQGDMDGIPVVLMEAMLSGIPVISSRISGIPELVEDGVTGLLCDENDEKSLAAKIKMMVLEVDLKNKLCDKAILKVKKDFELNKNVKMLSSLF